MSTPTPLLVHRTKIRVRYADTDKMQIVYNGKYFEYFEVGRTELLRDLGLTYADFEKSGTRLPVIEAHCRYFIPATYDDIIIIECKMYEMPMARMRLDYSILREADNAQIATGFTVHAFQDIETNKVRRPPAVFLETLKKGVEK